MKWNIKKDDSPDYYEFFYNSLKAKDRNYLNRLIQRLSNLTANNEKGFFCFDMGNYWIYVESCVQDNKDNHKNLSSHKNFIIQYITPVFNFIIEGILREKSETTLVSFHDYSGVANDLDTEIVDDNCDPIFLRKKKPLKRGHVFLEFDKEFFINNELNPLYLDNNEMDFMLLNKEN